MKTNTQRGRIMEDLAKAIEPEPAPTPVPAEYIPLEHLPHNGGRNGDVPRAGILSSQVFNDLTHRIISELRETVESQITDAVNRRQHAIAQMDQLRQEIDKTFGEFEASVKEHQEKVEMLADAVRKKVEYDTQQMIALSQRLQVFADSVNTAHEQFFKED